MRLVHAFCLACLNLRNEARKGSILKCAPRLFSCTHPRREALLVATQREHHRAFLRRHEMCGY
jgi:hypothetical protein